MKTVSVDLPADLIAQLGSGNASLEAARMLALELFRLRQVSLGRAAELCATPLAAFMDYSAARGVPPLNYDLNALEQDRRTLGELGL